MGNLGYRVVWRLPTTKSQSISSCAVSILTILFKSLFLARVLKKYNSKSLNYPFKYVCHVKTTSECKGASVPSLHLSIKKTHKVMEHLKLSFKVMMFVDQWGRFHWGFSRLLLLRLKSYPHFRHFWQPPPQWGQNANNKITTLDV